MHAHLLRPAQLLALALSMARHPCASEAQAARAAGIGNGIEFSVSSAAAHPSNAGPRYSVNKHVQQMRAHGFYHLCAYTCKRGTRAS